MSNILQLDAYYQVFENRSFLAFWLSFTFSAMGDAMTRVALTWYVYERTKSAQALAALTMAYTVPILIGGLLAGPLLDRYPRRRVMLVDNALRGLAIAAIPLLAISGELEIWHTYIFAAIYGSLMMISLAGSPALIPSIVRQEQLDTANALETLSFTLSNVIGPPMAGLLIVWVQAANVVFIDALSYFVFALVLLIIPIHEASHPATSEQTKAYSLMQATRLMTSNKILLSTTLMFMAFNVGAGVLTVLLPVLAEQISSGDAKTYGIMLGALALGELSSAVLAGSLILSIRLGKRIALAQISSSLGLIFLLLGPYFWPAALGLFLLGFFSAPLTIWAQTLRMQIIPPELRGRAFALLRTLMQGATPLGGALVGFLLPWIGISVMIGLSALLIGLPGLVGLRITELIEAG